MKASTSVTSTLVSAPSLSNRQSSTRSADSLKMAKFVPLPSYVAPSGWAEPGQESMAFTVGSSGGGRLPFWAVSRVSSGCHGTVPCWPCVSVPVEDRCEVEACGQRAVGRAAGLAEPGRDEGVRHHVRRCAHQERGLQGDGKRFDQSACLPGGFRRIRA